MCVYIGLNDAGTNMDIRMFTNDLPELGIRREDFVDLFAGKSFVIFVISEPSCGNTNIAL